MERTYVISTKQNLVNGRVDYKVEIRDSNGKRVDEFNALGESPKKVWEELVKRNFVFDPTKDALATIPVQRVFRGELHAYISNDKLIEFYRAFCDLASRR